MKKMKRVTVALLLLLSSKYSLGQDPSFSQFFSSPLNINPALTGAINSDWRFISNLRDQWIGPASPYVTGTVSFDSKILQQKMLHVEEKNTWAVGSMLMFDHAMSGVVKSVYGSANLSYNMKLGENYRGDKYRLGIGFGATYGRRYVDYSRVDFEEQFTGHGFNTNLPTGEVALSNMKPYVSASAGLLYSYITERSNFDMGVAAYHINKPKQTFLEDDNQILPIRKVAHANFETYFNERVVFNVNGIYQFQKEATYFSVGAAVGYLLGDANETLVTGGLWYWSENAVVPYVGVAYGKFQFGASYDLTVSKLNQASRKPNTWELSIILRGSRSPTPVIPCPWK
jgi:type IX secretion system PorP/SprF family membrane protein